MSRSRIEEFRHERGYLGLVETSAKTGQGCAELGQAIVENIRWNEIPWRTSPLLFQRLREGLMSIKASGRVLMRFNELRTALALQLAGEGGQFTDDELQAVISLLAGPGVVWELKFGKWILLQPERINAYAQAVIQTLREDEVERGCLWEERILSGDLTYQSTLPRLDADEERFVLLAMHQTLVERGVCLREHTEEGTLLVFPSYYRRERPELSDYPAVLVTYRFTGFTDEIYATLVVRLHHTKSFVQDRLWRYAADFKTLAGKQLGVKLSRRSEGSGELAVYFDPSIGTSEKMIFSKYVHEHLLKTAKDVERLRHYVCPACFTPVGNPEVAMKRMAEGKPDILCINCESRFPLMDDLEALFTSAEMNYQVKVLEEKSDEKLERESSARSLVGEVVSTVALAGQVIRELPFHDEGVHMAVEFSMDDGRMTGRKLYLQLLTENTQEHSRDNYGAPRGLQPLMVVFRDADAEVRWVSPEGYRAGEADERFDVMAVREYRSRTFLPSELLPPKLRQKYFPSSG